jgi:hypothetical protein
MFGFKVICWALLFIFKRLFFQQIFLPNFMNMFEILKQLLCWYFASLIIGVEFQTIAKLKSYIYGTLLFSKKYRHTKSFGNVFTSETGILSYEYKSGLIYFAFQINIRNCY